MGPIMFQKKAKGLVFDSQLLGTGTCDEHSQFLQICLAAFEDDYLSDPQN